MRWKGRRESNNVEDQRGSGGGGFGGGGAGLPLALFSRLGIKGTIVVVIVGLIVWKVFGINPLVLLGGGQMTGQQVQSQPYKETAEQAEAKDFVSTVLADTEDTWSQIFSQQGATYTPPSLVLFSGSTRSGCGAAQSAMGPFYCPADQKVYIDTSFFQEMRQKLGVSGDQQNSSEGTASDQAGDFAQAYVIAHEVGHHIQNLMGTSAKVQQVRQQSSKAQGNALSVKLELQADCYAGVWAYHNQQRTQFLQAGDVDEALDAANKIGDDYLQKQAQGYAVPDSFTHGTSAQREHWFKQGFDSGDMSRCDTFATGNL